LGPVRVLINGKIVTVDSQSYVREAIAVRGGRDYMTVPVEPIGGIESLLTMVGGKVVYAAGPYRQ
jgi:predicted amidohydrolase YtcJ